MEDFFPERVTEAERAQLAVDGGSKFEEARRNVERFLEFVFGPTSIARDHYAWAELGIRDDGRLSFKGFGREFLGKLEYDVLDGQWFSRYVFYDILRPIIGDPTATPVYVVLIEADGHVDLNGSSQKWSLYPQMESMVTGQLYNRLKADLLCVARRLYG